MNFTNSKQRLLKSKISLTWGWMQLCHSHGQALVVARQAVVAVAHQAVVAPVHLVLVNFSQVIRPVSPLNIKGEASDVQETHHAFKRFEERPGERPEG